MPLLPVWAFTACSRVEFYFYDFYSTSRIYYTVWSSIVTSSNRRYYDDYDKNNCKCDTLYRNTGYVTSFLTARSTRHDWQQSGRVTFLNKFSGSDTFRQYALSVSSDTDRMSHPRRTETKRKTLIYICEIMQLITCTCVR